MMLDKLQATTAVTDLVSTRIYPASRRQSAALPAIVYQRISTTIQNASVGESGTAWARVQVDCMAETFAGARALAAAVKGALSGWTDTDGTPAVSMCHWVDEQDAPGGLDEGEDDRVYDVIQDYYIQYSTA